MNKEKLLLATTNPGKAKEIKTFLAEFPLEIFMLQEVGIKENFIEQGMTFAQNARGKSLYYSKYWEGLTLAEDSGLEIVYLSGAPGVQSARFSGHQATDEMNNKKVLQLMKGVPFDQRKASFVSYMVLSKKEAILKEIKECVQGFINYRKRGKGGFGYDPLFYYPPLRKTFAELTPEEKNKISHRGQALKKLKEFLHSYRGILNT